MQWVEKISDIFYFDAHVVSQKKYHKEFQVIDTFKLAFVRGLRGDLSILV